MAPSIPAAHRRDHGSEIARAVRCNHLGIDPAFQPATKAHVAFVVDDLAEVRSILRDAGRPILEDDAGIDIQRCYTEDPFGKRVELVAAGDRGFSRRSP